MSETKHILIAGGGTGGHVFPAIAIAEAIKEIVPEAKILFLGAQGKLEMKKVPEAGFDIIGLPVKGLKRKLTLDNLKTLWLLFKSVHKTRRVFNEFKPCAVVGVGGYASAPALRVAAVKKVPIILQEQNSYPGITNRIFAKHAVSICVAYEENLAYFPRDKVVITGNPLRKQVVQSTNVDRAQALEFFDLNPAKKTLFITGGSLGARTLNNAVLKNLRLLEQADIQVVWQTGKYYYENIQKSVSSAQWLRIYPFIDKMPYAYAVADLIIARAGAITISELSLVGKPTIFVPSPNVAEDHQTKNAMALVNKNAALMVKDEEAEERLIPLAIRTIQQDEVLTRLAENIRQFAKPDAAKQIAQIIINNCL